MEEEGYKTLASNPWEAIHVSPHLDCSEKPCQAVTFPLNFRMMNLRLKMDHLYSLGILHTWFETESRISSHEDVRHLRDRMMHALLGWSADPVWVASLDHLEISDQWTRAFEGLFQDLRAEGLKDIIPYAGDEQTRQAWENHRMSAFPGAPGFGLPLCSSREEAFSRAATIVRTV